VNQECVEQQSASIQYSAIIDVLERYYAALYRCDIALLSTVFHPSAQYFTASSGKLLHLDMDAYLPIVKQRISPESCGESYKFSIDSIQFAGPMTAIARMYSSLFAKDFIDLLTLIRIDAEWKIISKVFHYVEHSDVLESLNLKEK
jgi:Putative lumazine-binding